MRKRAFIVILAAVLALCGCNGDISSRTTTAETEQTTKTTKTTTEAVTETAETVAVFTTTEEPEQSGETEPVEQTEPAEETTTEEITEVTDTQPVTTTTEAVTATEPVATTEAPDTDVNSYSKVGESGILVQGINGHYMGLMPCWGTYGLCDKYVSSVNGIADKLDGVNVWSMVIPTSIEFYLPESITGFTALQKNKIDYIAEGLSGVTNVDAYSALEEHKDEPIFARTDHHWLPLGAYYAAQAFSQTADFAFSELDAYKAVSRDDYVGSMYFYSKDTHLKNDPETFTMYIPEDKTSTTYYDCDYKNGTEGDLFTAKDASAYYCSFLGTDMCIAEIDTQAESGRTLVIFKESYGNALVPFLTAGFDKIYVCDVRYFNLNGAKFCKKVGATDVLFATCTFTPAGGNCSYVEYVCG